MRGDDGGTMKITLVESLLLKIVRNRVEGENDAAWKEEVQKNNNSD